MIKIKLRQARRPHDGHQLHDELRAAGLSPERVFVDDVRTGFRVPDEEAARAREVIAAHAPGARPAPPDKAALIARVRAAAPGTAEQAEAVADALEALL